MKTVVEATFKHITDKLILMACDLNIKRAKG